MAHLNNAVRCLGVVSAAMALAAAPVPFVPLLVVWLALLFAAIAACCGDRTWPLVTFVICGIDAVVLLPAVSFDLGGEGFFTAVTMLLFVAVFACYMLAQYRRRHAATITR